MFYVLNPNGSKLRFRKNLVWNSEICKIVYMSARDIKKSFAVDKLLWENIDMKSKRRFCIKDVTSSRKYTEPVKVFDYIKATLVPVGYELHIDVDGKIYKNCTVSNGKKLEVDMPVMYYHGSLCVFSKDEGFMPILLN